jgi:hypothetical protein
MNHDSAIAKMLARQAAYNVAKMQAQETQTVHVGKTDKPVKATKPVKDKATKPVKDDSSVGFSPTIVGRREKIDAETFLVRMRTVRYVSEEGRHLSRSPDRAEKIQTIADFMGIYSEGDGDAYGTIEQRAMMECRRQRGMVMVEDRRAVRSVQASVGGFITGIADAKAKLLASLRGREREAVENIIAATHDGDDDAVAIERERLQSIRKDLASL